MPTKIYNDWNRPYEAEYIKQPTQHQDLFITEPTDGKFLFFCIHTFIKSYFFLVHVQKKIPLEKEKPTVLSNPFERLRPLDFQNETISPLRRPLKSSVEKMQYNDNNDSSTSTTNRSIHLPVEKQRGLSEIIRKRNSRYKVEDYKRSFQKSNTFDEQQSDSYRPLTTSTSDYTLSNDQTSISNISPRQIKRLNKTKSVDISIEFDKQMPIPLGQFQSNEKISQEKISNKYVINYYYSGVACRQLRKFSLQN
jgi:hypothetical protein